MRCLPLLCLLVLVLLPMVLGGGGASAWANGAHVQVTDPVRDGPPAAPAGDTVECPAGAVVDASPADTRPLLACPNLTGAVRFPERAFRVTSRALASLDRPPRA